MIGIIEFIIKISNIITSDNFGNFIDGAMTVVLGTKCFGFVMPGITSLPVYADPAGGLKNLLLMMLCIVSTFVIGAVLSFTLGGKIGDRQ